MIITFLHKTVTVPTIFLREQQHCWQITTGCGSFRSRRHSAQPTAGRPKAGRPEAARGAGDRGWQSDGRIDVGGADCGEIGAASTEPVDKAAQQTRRGPGRDGRAHALSPRGQGGRDDSRAGPSKVSRAGERRARSARGRARRRATIAAEGCEREPGRSAGPVRRERRAAKKKEKGRGVCERRRARARG